MADPNFDEREERLRQRELELRLRELESEVNRLEPTLHRTNRESSSFAGKQPPFHPTNRESSGKPARTFGSDLKVAAKLSGFFIGAVVVVFTAQVIAGLSFFIAIALAGWACFELGRNKK